MFVCYQDGKRCSSYGYSSWEQDSFDRKEDAERYCFNWAYPHGHYDHIAPQMDVGVEYDYSMSEFPVMMSIKEE